MHIFELFFHNCNVYFVSLVLCLLLQGCVHAPQTTHSRPDSLHTTGSSQSAPAEIPVELALLLKALLLISPENSAEEVLEGRRILQSIVDYDGSSEMAPYLRKLATTQLEILDTNQSLARQQEEYKKNLQDAEKKIHELLNIESSIESKRQQNEGNQP